MKNNESYTSLRGGESVRKDHPIIRLRGQLDLLGAYLIRTAALARGQGYDGLAGDLDALCAACGELMSCEVKGRRPVCTELIGLPLDALREASQNPKAYFGFDHFFPTSGDGLLLAELNLCRAKAREVEIYAVQALDERGCGEMLALYNRLSSALYLLMCRLRAEMERRADQDQKN